MKYLRHYIKLIKRAEARQKPSGYTEGHHIFPVSVFGKNKRIVHLTYKEHLVAHHLLYKASLERYGEAHNRTIKLRFALDCMLGFSPRGRCPSSLRIAKAIRKAYRSNRAMTVAHKKSLSLYMLKAQPFLGANNPNFDPTPRTWSNLYLGITELNITNHELAQKYPDTVSSQTLGRVARKEILQFKGWFISSTAKDLMALKYPKTDISICTWENKALGVIEYNTTLHRLKQKYPCLRIGSLKNVVTKKAKQHLGWKVVKDSIFGY